MQPKQPTSTRSRPWAVRPGFLVSLLVPAVLIASFRLGEITGHVDLFAFLPLVVAYVVVPFHNRLVRQRLFGDAIGETGGVARGAAPAYYRVVPLLALPAQLAMLFFATDYWSTGGLGALGMLGTLGSTGLYSSLLAINTAHELIHRGTLLERAIGGLLLSTVTFGSFKIVHLRVHHRFVGTRLDPSSARRGQNLYSFWLQSVPGGIGEAWRAERATLASPRWWRSELLLWYGCSALWCTLAWSLAGITGVVFFLLQSLVAILKLEMINYVQHYGLERRAVDGRFEPVTDRHSWSQEAHVTNLALFNLFRHADHHANPGRPYEALRLRSQSPTYPLDVSLMVLLALVPPWWRRVVHPHLDALPAA